MADSATLPRSWSFHDQKGLYAGCAVLRSFDVLLDGETMERVRAYDCDAGTVTVIDAVTPIMAGKCVEKEMRGSVTLRLKGEGRVNFPI